MAKLIGLARLGRDAEQRYTAGGDAVANLALAFNYGKKQDGKQPTQWVDASLWGKRAEALSQYLTKGTAIVVTLSDVHVEEFQRKDGGQGSKLVARVDDLEFAGSGGEQRQQAAPAPAPAPAPQQGDAGGGLDGDVPFAPVAWWSA